MFSAVLGHLSYIQSSCVVTWEWIKFYMGSIVTAVTTSGVWKCIPLEVRVDTGHLENIPKDTRAAKYSVWEAGGFQFLVSCCESRQGQVTEMCWSRGIPLYEILTSQEFVRRVLTADYQRKNEPQFGL